MDLGETYRTEYWLRKAVSSSSSSSLSVAYQPTNKQLNPTPIRNKTCRIPQSKPFERFHILRHSRTHQKGLIHLGQVTPAEDLSDIFVVAVGEDEICFVDDERFEGGKGECLGELLVR